MKPFLHLILAAAQILPLPELVYHSTAFLDIFKYKYKVQRNLKSKASFYKEERQTNKPPK